MKTELLDVIQCPLCRRKFSLVDEVFKSGEVFSGKLLCAQKHSFSILRFVPRLIESENYSSSWEKLWKETDSFIRDSKTGVPFYHDAIHGKYGEENSGDLKTNPFGFLWPTQMPGEKILEVGPGTGVCTEHLVKTGAEITAVDMSAAVDVFPEDLLTQKNLNVIQADINTPFISENYFDRIWLFQVLQHTPSPPATLKRLRDLLKPGGEIAFTSYYGRYNPWYYWLTKRINRPFMWKSIEKSVPRLVPFKYKLQKFFLDRHFNFGVKVVKKLLEPIDPRNMYLDVMEGRSDDYPQGVIWKKTKDKELLFRMITVNTFDCITPDYTNCATHEEVEGWCKEIGFSKYRTWGKAGVRAIAQK